MEKLQNFEFQFSFFMKTLLASQINDYLTKDDPLDLKKIEEKIVQRQYMQLDDIARDLSFVCNLLKKKKDLDPKLFEIFYQKMRFHLQELKPSIEI